MTKFIATSYGKYVNIDQISSFYVYQLGIENFCVIVNVIIHDKNMDDKEWKIVENIETEEKAQEWLDKFIEKHGLCL